MWYCVCLVPRFSIYFGPSEGLLKGWEPSEALSLGVKQLLGAFRKPLAFWVLVKQLLGAFWKFLPSRSPYPPGMVVKPLLVQLKASLRLAWTSEGPSDRKRMPRMPSLPRPSGVLLKASPGLPGPWGVLLKASLRQQKNAQKQLILDLAKA